MSDTVGPAAGLVLAACRRVVFVTVRRTDPRGIALAVRDRDGAFRWRGPAPSCQWRRGAALRAVLGRPGAQVVMLGIDARR